MSGSSVTTVYHLLIYSLASTSGCGTLYVTDLLYEVAPCQRLADLGALTLRQVAPHLAHESITPFLWTHCGAVTPLALGATNCALQLRFGSKGDGAVGPRRSSGAAEVATLSEDGDGAATRCSLGGVFLWRGLFKACDSVAEEQAEQQQQPVSYTHLTLPTMAVV